MKKSLIVLMVCFSFPAWADKLSADVEELQRIQEANGKTLADTAQNITLLQQDLQAVRGSIEELRYFFQEESKKNEKVLKDFDLRLTGMEERLSLYESQLKEVLSAPVKTPSKAKKSPRSAGTVPSPASEDENTLYRQALTELNAQNNQTAITLLDQFLKSYPQSSLADNAQYWKGEALYASNEFPDAVLQFQNVIKKYPKSDKVPAAILKQGYCFFETKEYLDAKAFLQKVITDFPKSEEAVKAKEKIAQINHLLGQSRSGSTTQPASP